MITTRNRTLRRTSASAFLLAAIAIAPVVAEAQTSQNGIGSAAPTLAASLTLPDEPGTARESSATVPASSSSVNRMSFPASGGTAPVTAASSLPEASHTQKYIEPGQAAPSLTSGDKVLLGLKDAVSPFSALGWLVSAGYEQLVNGSPNYGTDRGAFGQRLGAAAIRDSTEGIFTDSVLSPVLREDPRYYRLGPTHNLFVRLIYAGTRPVIGRTDGGHITPNFASLGGNLAGSALASAYYPPLNRGATQTLETFGGSLGGSAVGDVVSEFAADVVHLVHPKKE